MRATWTSPTPRWAATWKSLRESGELDNTLVMYIVGDNGASPEGGLEGTFSELASLLRVPNLVCKARSIGSTKSADRRANRTCRSAGLGPWMRRFNGRSKWRRTSAATAQPVGRALAEGN